MKTLLALSILFSLPVHFALSITPSSLSSTGSAPVRGGSSTGSVPNQRFSAFLTIEKIENYLPQETVAIFIGSSFFIQNKFVVIQEPTDGTALMNECELKNSGEKVRVNCQVMGDTLSLSNLYTIDKLIRQRRLEYEEKWSTKIGDNIGPWGALGAAISLWLAKAKKVPYPKVRIVATALIVILAITKGPELGDKLAPYLDEEDSLGPLVLDDRGLDSYSWFPGESHDPQEQTVAGIPRFRVNLNYDEIFSSLRSLLDHENQLLDHANESLF